MSAKKPSKPAMETITPETLGELAEISESLRSLEQQISELKNRADELVIKHTFQECREIGCVHTYRCQLYCSKSAYCVRSKTAHGATKDYYSPPEPKFKERVSYPMLGWKTVTSLGSYYNGTWNWSRKVVKETDKCLTLDDGIKLFKSTIYYIEDCIFLRGLHGAGGTWFCADDESSLDIMRTLLKIRDEEMHEEAMRMLGHIPSVPDTEETNA